MLYLFHGSDVHKVRTKAFAWIEAARAKEPNLTYVRIAREDLSAAALDEVSMSGNLFAKRTLTLIDDPFPAPRKLDDDEREEEEDVGGSIIEERLAILSESENVIIILAPKLATTKVKKLGAVAKMIYVFDVGSSHTPVRGFNSSLVDALGSRAPEKLWLEIVRAVRAGDPPEMLHGLLHWKVRSILEKGSREWSAEEARALSLQLIELLQESRRGGQGLSESLERFALSI